MPTTNATCPLHKDETAKFFRDGEYFYGSMILVGILAATALFTLSGSAWSALRQYDEDIGFMITFCIGLDFVGSCYIGLAIFSAMNLRTHRRLYGHYYRQ